MTGQPEDTAIITHIGARLLPLRIFSHQVSYAKHLNEKKKFWEQSDLQTKGQCHMAFWGYVLPCCSATEGTEREPSALLCFWFLSRKVSFLVTGSTQSMQIGKGLLLACYFGKQKCIKPWNRQWGKAWLFSKEASAVWGHGIFHLTKTNNFRICVSELGTRLPLSVII